MTSMIEKVARAISDEPIGRAETLRTAMWKIADATGISWDEAAWQRQMQVLARAAIQALMEPTSEMLACEDIHWGYSCHICGGLTEGWHAMLTAALEGER